MADEWQVSGCRGFDLLHARPAPANKRDSPLISRIGDELASARGPTQRLGVRLQITGGEARDQSTNLAVIE